MLFYCIAILWLILDQISKFYIVEHMSLGESIPLIEGYFNCTYILNRGAAFGILTDQHIFFLCIVVLLVLAYLYFRKTIHEGPKFLQIGAALLLSGALGNGWDRFYRSAVVDFFDFRVWPIFNVADIGICLGVLLIVIYLITCEDDEK